MSDLKCAELVRIRVNEGCREQFNALQSGFISHYLERFGPRVGFQSFEAEDGTWLGLWAWESRQLAEEVMAEEPSPALNELNSISELVSVEWLVPGEFGAGGA